MAILSAASAPAQEPTAYQVQAALRWVTCRQVHDMKTSVLHEHAVHLPTHTIQVHAAQLPDTALRTEVVLCAVWASGGSERGLLP